MGADNQAESVPERKRLPAIAKIKQDLTWRSVTGVPMEHIVLTRQQAAELVAEFERLRTSHGCIRHHLVAARGKSRDTIRWQGGALRSSLTNPPCAS